MSEMGGIRKNAFFSLVTISSRLLTNVVVFWIIARFYGPQVFGQFTFVHTLATIFILIADFGFDTLLITEVARDKTNTPHKFQVYFTSKLLLILISMLLMYSVPLFGSLNYKSMLLILIFGLYVLFSTTTNYLLALFKSFEKFHYETKISLVVNVGTLVVVLLIIFGKANIFIISLGFILTRAVGLVLGIRYMKKTLPQMKVGLVFGSFSKSFNKAIAFGLIIIFSNLFLQLDTILIAFLKSEKEVGIYQSVSKIIFVLLIVPQIINNTLVPILSRLYHENYVMWEKIGFVANKLLFLTILPFSIILYSYSKQIISLIYGIDKYGDAVPILKVFAITIIIRYLYETIGVMLTTSGRQNKQVIVLIVATFLNFTLNILFIPLYGIEGSAYISLATNAFIFIAFYFITRSTCIRWIANVKTLALVILTMLLLFALNNLTIRVTIFLAVPLVVMLYVAVGYYFLFSSREKELLFRDLYKLFPFTTFRTVK